MEPQPVVHSLAVQYLNERGTKRLLQYNSDLVERVVFLLQRQKKKMAAPEIKSKAAGHIYKMETERIEWLLTEYLLVRLEKIRESYYLEDAGALSEAERAYFAAYVELKREQEIYVEKEEIPARLQEAPAGEFAGFYVLEEVPDAVVDSEPLALAAGDFLIADITSVYDLIESASVVIV